MRIMRLNALAVLAAILLPPGAAAQVRTEPSIAMPDPLAASTEPRRVKTIRIRSTDVSREPLPLETGRIRCAGASELCAWKRIPDSWDGGFEAPPAPQ